MLRCVPNSFAPLPCALCSLAARVQAGEDLSDSEEEDFTAKLSDAFVLVGNTEEDHSVLEVHVYDEAAGSLFGPSLRLSAPHCSGPAHTARQQCTTTSRFLLSRWLLSGWIALLAHSRRVLVRKVSAALRPLPLSCQALNCGTWM